MISMMSRLPQWRPSQIGLRFAGTPDPSDAEVAREVAVDLWLREHYPELVGDPAMYEPLTVQDLYPGGKPSDRELPSDDGGQDRA